MKLRELADRLQCRLEGDGDAEVVRVTGIEEAGRGDLTFFANPRYAQALRTTRATAVIAGEQVENAPCAVLRSEHPYLTFAEALALFHPPIRPAPGIDPRAVVAADAECGPDVAIGPFVTVGAGARIGARTVVDAHVTIGRGAVVGEECLIHSHVSIREGVVLGSRVILQNGAVIGSDGFGFARQPDGRHHKIPQVGIVVIEDDVEVGANATIDRPSVGETRIGAGTKIDNLVQIAHGVRVGRDVLLAAQVGIAGSTIVEDQVTLAGQVGVAGHLTLGRGVIASAQSGIPNSVPPGAFVSGYPAVDNREWLKSSAIVRRLPELKKTLARLEARVEALERALSDRQARNS